MRRMLCAALLIVFTLLGTASASALTGSPLNLATPFASGAPSVAVDSAGNAVIAWANTKDLAGAKNFVQWCVVPVGGTACSASGNLQPAGSGQYIENVQVLADGATLVILADVYGTTTTEYEPVQEWQSTDGGHSFTIINSGKSVAASNPSNDTVAVGAVVLPGTSVLGFAFDTAAEVPTFHAFPLASPTVCGRESGLCTDGYATLEPNTNPDVVSNAGAGVAANSSGVMGVYETNYTNGPLGCSNALTVPFGTAYVYGSGPQGASNNYNVSPGQPNSAWRVAVTQADCNVEYAAVGAGPAGFGVLETNELTKQTVYHRFDTNTNTFDTAPVAVAPIGEQQPALSQDGSGGVYATYLAGGPGGPVSLSYSANGGGTWSGPGTLSAPPGVADLTSHVNATGQGWAAWVENGSVFAQSFQASDSVPAPTPTTLSTSQSAGAVSGPSISVPEGTVGMTDRATISGVNAAAAAGTISYTLYSKADCSAPSAVASSTEAVSAGSAAPSSPVTALLAEGKYYWRATYSGNAGNAQGAVGNQPSASACGSEVLTIGPANSIAASGTSEGQTVTVTVSCATVPCTITITLTATETVVVKASVAKRRIKHRTVRLGSATFTIRKKGPAKLLVKLSKTGRRYMARHHGRVPVNLATAEKTAGGVVHTSRTIQVKLSKAHKKH